MASELTPTTPGTFAERFSSYFQKDVAQQAAKSLGKGAEVEFRIPSHEGKPEEVFFFNKSLGKNEVSMGPAQSPQLLFTIPAPSAESILADPAEDIGSIGVGILKKVVSTDANLRVSVQFKSGFFSLFTHGYFGILSAGGSAITQFLSSRGLSGMDAIKLAIKRFRP